MSISAWIRSFAEAFRRPVGRTVLLTGYYLLIIAALVMLYGQGDSAATEFIYQGF